MTASCLSTPRLVSAGAATVPLRLRLRAARGRGCAGGLLLVTALVLSAVLMAPEQPMAQANICERHNGAAACRVW